ncbi:hypothetical protein LCGC14_0547920 [marine sediment metagenome]|uniref:Uncharacterized protein n=1 Tax=marine sediment metagenome TaxID=412755 RepID=A0A0F9RQZ4_9ZZZZ
MSDFDDAQKEIEGLADKYPDILFVICEKKIAEENPLLDTLYRFLATLKEDQYP